jgi:hypothetical protein
MIEVQYNYITDWQRKTFPDGTALSQLRHLSDEVNECYAEVALGNREKAKVEFADCFILLFGSASRFGLGYEEILDAIDDKMLINEARTWNKPDGNGVVKHVE